MSREVLSYQFDDVVIDLRAGRVLRAGTPAPLEPKAYDLLVLLASRSGELVTRQEVLDRVWAGVYVTDNAVARVIAQVRRVLGDSARASRYIETVPTRGYRFIVPVTPPVRAAAGHRGRRQPVPTAAAGPSPDAARRLDRPAPRVTGRRGRATADAGRDAAGPSALGRRPGAGRPGGHSSSPGDRRRPRRHGSARPRGSTRTQITSSAALDAFPAWSPDGRTLAYASDRGGRFEIFIRDLTAGGDRIALTADRQHNVQPAWSPDGSRLAYHSSGRGGIWIVARVGRHAGPDQPLRIAARMVARRHAHRLPGRAVHRTGAAAFETFGPSSLWVVDLDGSANRAWRRDGLATGRQPRAAHMVPRWAPALLRQPTARHDRLLDRRSRVRRVDARPRGSAPGPSTPTLTPDGRAVYYVRMGDHFDLWKLPLTRTAPPRPRHSWRCRRANSTSATSPCTRRATSWPTSGWRRSPACAACRCAGTALPAGPSVRIAEDAVRRARRPSFSPDARQVAFERQVAGGPPGLWLLDLAQGSVRALTARPADARDPAWSRDGSRVLLRDRRGRPTWSCRRCACRTAAPRSWPAWPTASTRCCGRGVSPDGTRLAYTRSSEGQLEVWIRDARRRHRHARRAPRRWGGVSDLVARRTAVAVDVWRDGHAQVYVADLASGAITQVSRDVDQAWVRSWSPDGTRLAFAGATDGRWNVWSVRRDGTRPPAADRLWRRAPLRAQPGVVAHRRSPRLRVRDLLGQHLGGPAPGDADRRAGSVLPGDARGGHGASGTTRGAPARACRSRW